ncbi:hypothetical protein HI914_06880 [Erysiphe necator]|nr:hypothetical protein HI914_06880 [Erysiphe necator]
MADDYPSFSSNFLMSHFQPNAILRGAQLTIVGALRALRNPSLLTSRHYKQVAIAIACGIAIRIAIALPVLGIKVLLWLTSFVFDYEYVSWSHNVANGLGFIQNSVLQVPFFLMTVMRNITPTLDEMFMESLAWVDSTYYKKHEGENSASIRNGYYENLSKYPTRDIYAQPKSAAYKLKKLISWSSKKAGISLLIFILSYTPVVGQFVLPGASFYTFQKVIGLAPAGLVFGIGIFLPRTFLVIFLQSYFASRNLMRELLEPYFCRIRFTKTQKKNWFHDREGLLFGFGIGFYLLIRIPFLGVLIYGIAEASAAYLITKITDPPPPPNKSEGYAATQQYWTTKIDFLRLSFSEIDKNTHSKKTLPTSNLASMSFSNDSEPPPYQEIEYKSI